MDWITDTIAIGNYVEVQDADLLRTEGIRSVLGLIRTLQSGDTARLGLQRIEVIPLVDGPGNDRRVFERAVDTLAELASSSPPVLVHCRAGRSRSVVVVAGHLMKSLGINEEEALHKVMAKRDTYVPPDMVRLLDWIE